MMSSAYSSVYTQWSGVKLIPWPLQCCRIYKSKPVITRLNNKGNKGSDRQSDRRFDETVPTYCRYATIQRNQGEEIPSAQDQLLDSVTTRQHVPLRLHTLSPKSTKHMLQTDSCSCKRRGQHSWTSLGLMWGDLGCGKRSMCAAWADPPKSQVPSLKSQVTLTSTHKPIHLSKLRHTASTHYTLQSWCSVSMQNDYNQELAVRQYTECMAVMPTGWLSASLTCSATQCNNYSLHRIWDEEYHGWLQCVVFWLQERIVILSISPE